MNEAKAIPQGYLTVGEVAKKMGGTVRTLQYYDAEGLLSPTTASEGGRRFKRIFPAWGSILLRSQGDEPRDKDERLAKRQREPQPFQREDFGLLRAATRASLGPENGDLSS